MYEFRVVQPMYEAMVPVWELTYQRYLDSGYCQPNPTGMLRHYPHLDLIPETCVLGAYDEEVLVGTNSLTLDSVRGLHVEATFPEEVRQIRNECFATGAVLGASWRIVTATPSMELVKGLVGKSVEIGSQIADITLYSFHPDHVRIYQKMLGLELIAGSKADGTVNGNPAVLMRGNMDKMLKTWAKRK
jgi:hypothetical protein